MRVPGPRTISDSVRYGFAVGKVRVLETRIFGRGTFERLLDAPSLREQLRVLSDTHYGRYLEGSETAGDVEGALAEALDGFYGFLEEAKLPESVVLFFRVRHDYANLKAKLKAEALGTGMEGMLSGLGTVPLEDFEGSPAKLPDDLAALYRETRTEEGPREAGVPDLAGIDAAVDRAMFAEALRLAEESRSDFLAGLARLMIDVANLKAALRVRLRALPPTELQRVLLPGGDVRIDEWLEAYARPTAELAELAASVPLLRELSPAEITDPAQLDVIADDIVVRYLRGARRVAVGAEPVIAYVMAREAEVVALRTLLIGRLAGVPSETLRERLRELYVM